jgi:hypothetical protein
MSLDDRVHSLEQEYAHIDQLLTRVVAVQEEQSGVMRDVVRLLGSMDDRLGRIEEYLRPPGRDGGGGLRQ